MLYYAPLKETSTIAAFLAVNPLARVVKLVDTRDLKSLDRKVVPVRFRPRAPKKSNLLLLLPYILCTFHREIIDSLYLV